MCIFGHLSRSVVQLCYLVENNRSYAQSWTEVVHRLLVLKGVYMRLLTFLYQGKPRWGRVGTDQIILASSMTQYSLRDAFKHFGQEALETLSEEVSTTDVHLLSPVPDAEKVICVGLNYKDHIAETGREMPEYPVIFIRFADSLVGDEYPLLVPPESSEFDFEGELAVVIGKEGRRIQPESALDHVLGYTILNDGSMRDFQRQTHQFTPGKNFDSSGSFGPYIVTPDEFGDFEGKAIRTVLNGETVQHSQLDQLLFGVPELIHQISTWTTLRPGDVIATGTPGGVGMARTPKLWMRAGDLIEVHIDGIGTLSNTIHAEYETNTELSNKYLLKGA